MGVSGAGKSTIGKLLAKSLDWHFFDADSFHSQANIKKMSNGIPLNDAEVVGIITVAHGKSSVFNICSLSL